MSEVVIAPDADADARAVLATKKNLRLLIAGGVPDLRAPGVNIRTLAGGLLVQDRDAGQVSAADLKVVTKRAPSAREQADMLLAFRRQTCQTNAIIYVKEGATVAIGAGQMSRVDSARIAARKAEDAVEAAGAGTPATVGSVVASDAFFPFADGLLAAAAAGATAVIQPGGSIAMTRSSPPPTRPVWRWFSPACAISATEPAATVAKEKQHGQQRHRRGDRPRLMGMGGPTPCSPPVLRPMASTATSTPWRRLARPAVRPGPARYMAAGSMCW